MFAARHLRVADTTAEVVFAVILAAAAGCLAAGCLVDCPCFPQLTYAC